MSSGSAQKAVPATRRYSRRELELLENLEFLVLSEGFLHLSTNDLCHRLRCSKSTLYQIAPTLESLYEVVIERWLQKLREAGETASSRDRDPFRRIVAYLEVTVPATQNASARFVEDLARFSPGQRCLAEHRQIRTDGLARLLEDGMKANAFRGVHPKLLAEILLVSSARIMEPGTLTRSGTSLSEAFGEFYRVLEFGLRRYVRGRGATGSSVPRRKAKRSARTSARVPKRPR